MHVAQGGSGQFTDEDIGYARTGDHATMYGEIGYAGGGLSHAQLQRASGSSFSTTTTSSFTREKPAIHSLVVEGIVIE
jgi:hypothetical protein